VENDIYPVLFKAGGGNNFDKEWTSYVKGARATPSSVIQQIWSKPPGGAWAILYINANPNHTMDITLPFSKLEIDGSPFMMVRDIWARKEIGPTGHSMGFTPPPVLPRDCGFYLLTPVVAQIKEPDAAEFEHAPRQLGGAKVGLQI